MTQLSSAWTHLSIAVVTRFRNESSGSVHSDQFASIPSVDNGLPGWLPPGRVPFTDVSTFQRPADKPATRKGRGVKDKYTGQCCGLGK